LAINDASTVAEIETAVVNHLQTMEYYGVDPIGKSVAF
jgi:hypothetical protein